MSFRHGLPESSHRDVNIAIHGTGFPIRDFGNDGVYVKREMFMVREPWNKDMSFRHGLPESSHRDVNVAIQGTGFPIRDFGNDGVDVRREMFMTREH